MSVSLRVPSVDPSVPVLYVDSYEGGDQAAASPDVSDVEVTYETDPDRALDLVEPGRFECLVVGSEPAGGSGLAMLAAVRELTDVPVVLLGGDDPGPATAFEHGVDEYTRPPTDANSVAAVVARIRNVVGRRRAEQSATTERARSAALVGEVSAGVAPLYLVWSPPALHWRGEVHRYVWQVR